MLLSNIPSIRSRIIESDVNIFILLVCQKQFLCRMNQMIVCLYIYQAICDLVRSTLCKITDLLTINSVFLLYSFAYSVVVVVITRRKRSEYIYRCVCVAFEYFLWD